MLGSFGKVCSVIGLVPGSVFHRAFVLPFFLSRFSRDALSEISNVHTCDFAGGAGTEPFVKLLDGGEEGEFFSDMKAVATESTHNGHCVCDFCDKPA
eukprot:2009393-Amphidinium_carterae.1